MLLKCKANNVKADVPPLPPYHQLPPPTTPAFKHLCCDGMVLKWMQELMWTGAQRLDSLHAIQLAAQEASGVMVVAMLRQQGTL